MMNKLAVALFASVLVLTGNYSSVAQEYVPAEIRDLKSSPQRYWAKGFVFRDTLEQLPQRNRTIKIDSRTVTFFETRELGEVYAEADALENLEGFEVGKEYLFSGIIGQRERRWFRGGGEYFVIVQKAVPQTLSADGVLEGILQLQPVPTTNLYNVTLSALNIIIRDVERELIALYAATNISVKFMLDPANKQLENVATSVHKILRKVEDQSKIPLDKFLINLIISMMAMQHGYTEPPVEVYQPDEVLEGMITEPLEPLEGDSEDASLSKEQWDLSQETGTVEAVVAPVAEDVNGEEKPVVEPAIESIVPSDEEEELPPVEIEEVPPALEVIPEAAMEAPVETVEMPEVKAESTDMLPTEVPQEVPVVEVMPTPAEALEPETAIIEAPAAAVENEVAEPVLDAPTAMEEKIEGDMQPAVSVEPEKPIKKVKKKAKKKVKKTEPVESAPSDETVEPLLMELSPEPDPVLTPEEMAPETEPEVSPDVSLPQPEIDYSKPIRLR